MQGHDKAEEKAQHDIMRSLGRAGAEEEEGVEEVSGHSWNDRGDHAVVKRGKETCS